MTLTTKVRWTSTALLVAGLGLAALPSCASGPSGDRAVLLDTTRSAQEAPQVFRVNLETTRGPVVMEVHRDWSPWGVDRFYYLVSHGFYDGARFFRVLPNYIAQFGISGDPQIAASWRQRLFPDDTTKHQSNLRGRVSFASAGAHTRNTQIFINLRDNPNLDASYAPIGQIVEGMSAIDSLYSGYGEGPPNGQGPDQTRIFGEGTGYLDRAFPKLDYIKTARIVQ